MTTCTTCWRICRHFANAARVLPCAAWRQLARRASRARSSPLRSRRRDSWPTYHGDYSGQRHSPLTQITPDNVASAQAGVGVPDRPDAADQGDADSGQRRHLHHDARQHLGDRRAIGRQLWRYTYPSNEGFHIGHRGVAVYKDSVYPHDAGRASRRARRQARHGEVECRDRRLEARLLVDQRAAASSATTCSSASSGDFDNLPGILQVVRSGDGATSGRSTARRRPARRIDERRRHRRTDVDDRHLRSRAQPRVRRHRQSHAGAERRGAPRRQPRGPAASSRSIPTPASSRGDSRRRRTTRTTGMRRKCRCWSTATFGGAPRKLLMQASRNGYFFVLDRTTGKNLLTTPFAAVNWAKGHRRGRAARFPIRRRSRRATAC